MLATFASTMLGCAPNVVARPSIPGTSGSARYDIIIENGRIVDGTGAAWYYGDVGITGQRITANVPRGLLRDASSRQHIDANGMVVAPGFIDIQSGSTNVFLRW